MLCSSRTEAQSLILTVAGTLGIPRAIFMASNFRSFSDRFVMTIWFIAPPSVPGAGKSIKANEGILHPGILQEFPIPEIREFPILEFREFSTLEIWEFSILEFPSLEFREFPLLPLPLELPFLAEFPDFLAEFPDFLAESPDFPPGFRNFLSEFPEFRVFSGISPCPSSSRSRFRSGGSR